jgi:hypothetical protein
LALETPRTDKKWLSLRLSGDKVSPISLHQLKPLETPGAKRPEFQDPQKGLIFRGPRAANLFLDFISKFSMLLNFLDDISV